MNGLQKTVGGLIKRVVDHAMGSGLMQEETSAEGTRYGTPGIAARRAILLALFHTT